MPEYTLLVCLALPAVVLLELLVLRTGLLRMPAYWISMGIVLFFQVLVDGWLTKLSAPIVLYSPRQMLGVRFPWDIPIEDFAFGTTMVTLTLLLWLRATGHPREADAPRTAPAATRGRAPDHAAPHPEDRGR